MPPRSQGSIIPRDARSVRLNRLLLQGMTVGADTRATRGGMGNYFQNLAAPPRGNTPLRSELISVRVFIVMKHITKNITVLAALFVLAVSLSTSTIASAQNAESATPSALVAAAEPAPISATEAVFYVSGILDAQTDGAARLAAEQSAPLPLALPVPFRHMSYTNALMANLLRFQGYTIAAAYMQGRADAFKALADLLGEP